MKSLTLRVPTRWDSTDPVRGGKDADHEGRLEGSGMGSSTRGHAPGTGRGARVKDRRFVSQCERTSREIAIKYGSETSGRATPPAGFDCLPATSLTQGASRRSLSIFSRQSNVFLPTGAPVVRRLPFAGRNASHAAAANRPRYRFPVCFRA